MTQQSRLRRIGWFAVLALCTGLYLLLHIQVNAVHSKVVTAERRIVALEQQKMLLETEFQTRASQQQLASWNRVDFGYSAPTADQFIGGERQLAQLGTPPVVGAPDPIRLASNDAADEAPSFPQLVSPITGRAVDEELIEGERPTREAALSLPFAASGPMRVQLGAVARSGAE
ncbi:hypothetical protein [Altericroceibacterium xinjiangense]|uniref:hypothetical protein n=1 Tax=Altericroceibacterium xinjiangense TaxID=762261 RepID=UPI000F7E59AF|nr:hypothetical protein [Altericroceibacterium xinjiangense]